MSEVFISYARSGEAQAKRVEAALVDSGFAVWRDSELPAHRAYSEVIEERLRSAKAVVVLWSADAARSHWVRAEADAARGAGTLVQATIDGTIAPIPFNQIQCADLSGWSGDASTPGWRKLEGSVQALVGDADKAQASPGKSHKQQVSVCVLPFANMSGDSEQEYFSDGISEDITTDLSKVSALAVTARNTAFQFRGQSVDMLDVAKKLGVSHVLEGSVRKAGNRVRITAQLIEGATGDHVWADRYDRDLTDIFEIQDEISKAIVEALKVRLLPEEKKALEQRGTTNVEAYNYYLMAHSYWVTGNWGDARQAELVLRVSRRAVEIDPDYARAWGLLALAEWVVHFLHGAGEADGLAAAERALALDPTIAEAHIVRARHLHEQRRFDEARQALSRAIELGPESWEVNHEAAMIVYFQRRFDEAARYFAKAASIDETDFHSCAMLTSVYEALGDDESMMEAARSAVSRAEPVVAQSPTNGSALTAVATGLAILGETERFREWADRTLLVDPDNMIMTYNLACIMARRLKDYDGALDLIGHRLEKITPTLFRGVLTDPDLDGMRELPRFKTMIEAAKKRHGITD